MLQCLTLLYNAPQEGIIAHKLRFVPLARLLCESDIEYYTVTGTPRAPSGRAYCSGTLCTLAQTSASERINIQLLNHHIAVVGSNFPSSLMFNHILAPPQRLSTVPAPISLPILRWYSFMRECFPHVALLAISSIRVTLVQDTR